MGKGIQAPRGTRDLLGEELERLEALERLAANTAKLWGYSGIRTPIFEHTGLFTRSIGEATDIVEKEMFTVPPRGDGPSYSLRPENTAGVVRAYLEHNLHKTQGLAKLHYVGPQFRRERPQKGRYREFNQMGAEVLGIRKDEPGANYTAYAEVMLLAAEILARAGLKGLQLRYNGVGCSRPGCRDSYRENLKKELSARKEKLCGDCQRRIDRNVFRVLDCKKPNCRETCAETLVKVPQDFCGDCLQQLDFVLGTVENSLPAGADWKRDSFLVRGLDYYTGTVFELVAEGLGAQDAVGGGGSYDGLIAELGGPELGATGFALGLDRALIAQGAAGVQPVEIPEVGPLVYVASGVAGAAAKPTGRQFGLAVWLRQQGLHVEFDLAGRRLNKQLSAASRLGARLAVIIGEEEQKAEEANLKDMETGEQRKVKQVDLAGEIRKALS